MRYLMALSLVAILPMTATGAPVRVLDLTTLRQAFPVQDALAHLGERACVKPPKRSKASAGR